MYIFLKFSSLERSVQTNFLPILPLLEKLSFQFGWMEIPLCKIQCNLKFWQNCLTFIDFLTFYHHWKGTSSAGAEISDGPHKGGLRRAGPNDFVFAYNLIQRDLSVSILFLSFCFVSHVFYFLQLEYNSQSCNLRLLDGTVYYSQFYF